MRFLSKFKLKVMFMSTLIGFLVTTQSSTFGVFCTEDVDVIRVGAIRASLAALATPQPEESSIVELFTAGGNFIQVPLIGMK